MTVSANPFGVRNMPECKQHNVAATRERCVRNRKGQCPCAAKDSQWSLGVDVVGAHADPVAS